MTELRLECMTEPRAQVLHSAYDIAGIRSTSGIPGFEKQSAVLAILKKVKGKLNLIQSTVFQFSSQQPYRCMFIHSTLLFPVFT